MKTNLASKHSPVNQDFGISLETKIKEFWEEHPLCSHLVDSEAGTKAFFKTYDSMRAHNEPDEFVEEWLAPSRSGETRVLDVGCGNGYILAKFEGAGATSFGIDLTAKALELTNARLNLAGLEAKLLQADATELPFPDHAFDLVYSLGVLHHSPNTEQCFGEIQRVLRPGGKIVAMLYNKNSIFYRLRIPAMKFFNPQFRGWNIQEICNYLDGPGNPLGKFYKRKDIKRMLKGFSQLRFQPYFFSYLHFPGKPNIFPKFLCDLIGRHFGWFLYASGIKV